MVVAARRVFRASSRRAWARSTVSAPDASTSFRAHAGQRPRPGSVIHQPPWTERSTASAVAVLPHSVQVHSIAGPVLGATMSAAVRDESIPVQALTEKLSGIV